MHTKIKTGEYAPTVMACSLDQICVKIVSAPSVQDFRKMISVFMLNTWSDAIETEFSDDKIDKCIDNLFKGNILPTGKEIINITWSVSGINMIDTTHLIRHRLFSFSAQTHADRDMRNDTFLIPPSILGSEKFLRRYADICGLAHKLYMDMMDSGEVSCLDARTIMPRNVEHFYIVRSCLGDIINFVKMRSDEQIQTQTDNIIAMQLWLEILKLYPFLYPYVNFREPDKFYVEQCKQGMTNIFPPNGKNKLFTYLPSQFIHDRHRDDFIGGDLYKAIREDLLSQIDEIGKGNV